MRLVIFLPFILSFFITPIRVHAQTGQDQVYSFVVSLWPKGDKGPEYPRKKTQDTSLLAGIVDGIRTGKIKAYKDSAFTTPLSVAEVNKIVRTRDYTDTFVFSHAPNNEEVLMIVATDIDFFALINFRILAKGRSDVALLGIGIDRQRPRMNDHKEYGDHDPISPTATLFWVKYAQVSKIIATYNATHNSHRLRLQPQK